MFALFVVFCFRDNIRLRFCIATNWSKHSSELKTSNKQITIIWKLLDLMYFSYPIRR